MKRTILLILLLATGICTAPAQLSSNRTANTMVSDALAMLPAKDAATLDIAMGDLVATGATGMELLTGMFDNVNNVPVNYALNGLCYYVTGDNGNEAARAVYEQGIIAGLGKAADTEVKRFYIQALARAGSDTSVPVLVNYITDGQLGEPALYALAVIGTPDARQAVKNAVMDGQGEATALADAAGYMRLEGIYPQLEKWLSDGSADTGAVYYAMAGTGEKKAVDRLSAITRSENFSDATGSAIFAYEAALVNYMDTDRGDAAKRAKKLMGDAKSKGKNSRAIAAFEIYAAAGGKNLDKEVLKALDDPDRSYRAGMLGVISAYADKSLLDRVAAKSANLKDSEARADAFHFIASNSDGYGDYFASYVTGTDEETSIAAIEALSLNKSYPIAAVMLEVMAGDASARVIDAATSALLSANFHGEELGVAEAYSSAGSYGKAAILTVLGARQLAEFAPLVIEATADQTPEISSAAYIALPGVSGNIELPTLFGMLDKAPREAIPCVQDAILNATYGMDGDAKLNLFRSNMDKSSNKQSYYRLLASTGMPAALEMVQDAYSSENAGGKAEIVSAFSATAGTEAAEYLFKIAQQDGNQQALHAFVNSIASADLTPERKLLKYRAATELATDGTVRSYIAMEAGNLPIFQALIFCGEFLEDSDAGVRDMAAQGVMNIALANTDWYGPVVRGLLDKASGALSNPDASYLRQAIANHMAEIPSEGGFVSLFNGVDLTGWKGIVENPIARAAMDEKELARKQAEADELMRRNWTVENGSIVYIGDGYDNICTEGMYGDIEMYMDWMLYPEDAEADGGVYLRGTPQVQIWRTDRLDVGAQVGSGGLYNNAVNPSEPLVYADNPTGEWNTFRIVMKGERVSVWLNGDLVTDNVPLENFWDRSRPVFPVEQIELQGHTTRIAHKNIYIKELPMVEPYEVGEQERAEGFEPLFDGLTLDKWYGNTADYIAEDGNIVLYPSHGSGGNLYTKEKFGDFILRFEFMLTPGANNGIGIRTPDEGDPAYVGMEIQILDDDDPIYANLEEYQYHGSVYGVIPAKRGHLKPLGEWNYEEIYANGNHIRVTLNGVVIVDGDIAEASKNGTLDGKGHAGLKNKQGHVAFLGHGSLVKFRNLRIKRLD
ncbi:MAG: DUF1080 domain-containing protein [Alistipes sp.]|nr:DUF1080 domain-containing protein [Alistipes sp.]